MQIILKFIVVILIIFSFEGCDTGFKYCEITLEQDKGNGKKDTIKINRNVQPHTVKMVQEGGVYSLVHWVRSTEEIVYFTIPTRIISIKER